MSAVATKSKKSSAVSVKNPPQFDKGPLPLTEGDKDYVAKQIAEGADKAGISPRDFAGNLDLLASTGINALHVNGAVIGMAEFLHRKAMHEINAKVEKINKSNGHGVVPPDPKGESVAKSKKSDKKSKVEPISEAKASPKADKKAAPQSGDSGKGTRYDVLGFSATAVLRWMGKEGWNYKAARQCLDTLDNEQVSDTTIRIQLLAGKKGERGAPAEVSAKQAKQLLAAAKLPKTGK